MLPTRISAILLLWIPFAVWAQDQPQLDVPVEGVHRGFVWLFFAVFLGLIIYFFFVLFRTEKRRKNEAMKSTVEMK